MGNPIPLVRDHRIIIAIPGIIRLFFEAKQNRTHDTHEVPGFTKGFLDVNPPKFWVDG
jgi:hypothetical protein